MIEGVEWCPHCECEHKFNVAEDVWIDTCSGCGRAIVLCDKCCTMTSDGTYWEPLCNKCPHCNEAARINKEKGYDV